MKTCVCCGRSFPDDVGLCPACGVNLDDPQESSTIQIEIEVEPEAWSQPHQEIRRDPEVPQAPWEWEAVAESAPAGVSPDLMQVLRKNQYVYIGRMILLMTVSLCLLASILSQSLSRNSFDSGEFIVMLLVTVAPGLLGGLFGIVRSLGRLKKTPEELLVQMGKSANDFSCFFSIHERVVFSVPLLGGVISLGAFYTACMLEKSAPVSYLLENLRLIGKIGQLSCSEVDKLAGGIAISAMLIFLFTYPIRYIQLLRLKKKLVKTT